MLTQLNIRSFAIIDILDLDIPNGMTVITGETGAGKSIAIDALGLALGDRAEASMVKPGAKRSEITATFSLDDLPSVKKWLLEQELDEDEECILRRTISSEGGSRAYINGRPVPLQTVKTLSEKLIDIHSQHQHQSLLRQEEQRQLLDNYGQHLTLVNDVTSAYDQWNRLNKEYNALKNAADERASRIDFLSFQINELEELQVKENEWQTLTTEHAQFANAEKIQQAVSDSLDALTFNEQSIATKLDFVKQEVSSLADLIPQFSEVSSLLESASINIDEAIDFLRHQASDEPFDSKQFELIELRMATLLDASRKHRCEPENLDQVVNSLQEELNPLVNAEETLDEMENNIAEALSNYNKLAVSLTKSRKKSATKLQKACVEIITQLGMKDAKIEIDLIPLDVSTPHPFGNEKISFNVSTNPGSPFKPLAKVASGGELSRISLAIQVVSSNITKIPTLIFDEVDVGIGGGIAETVGKLLRQLSHSKQIICITHQAQVAAHGNTHWLVEKQTQAKSVITKIFPLVKEEREIEIARMIGGLNLTTATKKHAKEMLQNSQ